MRVIADEIIAARAGWSREIARGQVLRLVDLEGKQAVDFLCYNARDHEDRYTAADTMKINGNIFIRKGTVIYSVNCNPMLTVVDDTCGFHDTIGGCCSSGLNRKRYGRPQDPNCRQNFLERLAPTAPWTWGRASRSPGTTSICAPRWTCLRWSPTARR
jgi:uncharacterized protein YcgI (DUF1989 family)